jgi:RimJ/RimL family protein N-acetyltransferase
MPDTANYSVYEHLRDGSLVEIRSLRPDDEAGMLDALDQTSVQSLQRRFFGIKRHFSDKERAFFMHIDFSTHVALVAQVEQANRTLIIGGGRYVLFEPGRAEVAFVAIDAWQGRGVGTKLACHLIALGRNAGLKELTAEVLPENRAMRRVFEKLGFKPAVTRGSPSLHLALKLD